MNTKPVNIVIPAHAHMALRVFAASQGTTMQRLLLDAINTKYPSIRVLEPNPRPGEPYAKLEPRHG